MNQRTLRGQIYSLVPLTTRPPAQVMDFAGADAQHGCLVGVGGIEPPHNRLQRPAPFRLGDTPIDTGAGNETRTRDIYLGKVVLYQLSYSRIDSGGQSRNRTYGVSDVTDLQSAAFAARHIYPRFLILVVQRRIGYLSLAETATRFIAWPRTHDKPSAQLADTRDAAPLTGRGRWTRTTECWNQNPVPYQLGDTPKILCDYGGLDGS